MKRLPSAILLGLAVLQLVAPSADGFAVPQAQSSIGLDHNAMAFAWSILSIWAVAMSTYLLIREVHYIGIIWPLATTFVLAVATLATDAQGWWWISFVIVAAMLALLWRTFYILVKHRDQITLLGQWLVTTPVAIYAGWISVAMITRLADVLWNSGLPQTGTLSVAWQAILIILLVLTAGFGVEASRAHVAYAASVLWGCIHITISAGRADQDLLTAVALFATLIVLALFFIERAMFRGRRAQPASR